MNLPERKELRFYATTLDDLRSFPPLLRRAAGHQLDRVQQGLMPADFRPMPGVGPGVYEIRLRDVSGAFRVLYVAKYVEAVYVLHCFQKKTQKTSPTDMELAIKRYHEILREHKP